MCILVSYMYMQDHSHHSSESYEGMKSKGSGLGPELWVGKREVGSRAYLVLINHIKTEFQKC